MYLFITDLCTFNVTYFLIPGHVPDVTSVQKLTAETKTNLESTAIEDQSGIRRYDIRL